MKWFLTERYCTGRFAKKSLFETREDAIAHISECMVNDKVVAWVRENFDSSASHSRIWEIVQCAQEGDLIRALFTDDGGLALVFTDREHGGSPFHFVGGLEVEGERICRFEETKETFVSNTSGYSDHVSVTLVSFEEEDVIASRDIYD